MAQPPRFNFTSFSRPNRFQNNGYDNPGYRGFNQQQQQLLRDQDGELDQIGKNGK